MTHLKKFFYTIAAGGLIGAILFAWFSPSLIVWYFSPPSGQILSCNTAVEWAIVTYRKIMFTGVLLGAIVSGILFFAFRSKGKPGAQDVPSSAHSGPNS
jgi:hypothetical protein